MENRQISKLPVADTMTAAWNKVDGAKLTFFYALIIMVLIKLIFQVAATLAKDHSRVMEEIIVEIYFCINYLFISGIAYIGIMRAMSSPISAHFLTKPFQPRMMLNLILLYISKILICAAPVLIAMIISFIPGLIFGLFPHTGTDSAVDTNLYALLGLLSALTYIVVICIGFFIALHLVFRLTLSSGLVLVRNLNPFDAIKKSFHATRSNTWHIFLIYLCLAIIVLISMIPLGIGLIWTFPLLFITHGEVYKLLSVNVK